MSMSLPAPRGALSEALFAQWRGGPSADLAVAGALVTDPLRDDDLQLALWCCYQLHYGGFDGVDDALEWDPDVLRFRRSLEGAFEDALRAEHRTANLPDDASVALRVISSWAGPPLARTVEDEGERWQLEEFAVHRSAYQLKEADAHTWGIPRFRGPGRDALVEIQADEYGGGVPGEAHAELFADAMVELGLSPEPGHYVDRLPGVTLATDNLVSMFGLHRRLRGALIGHLALFEVCSVAPMTRYLNAARRLGGMPALERFYRVHVEADVHHAELALSRMVGGLVAQEPDLAPSMIFGAAALHHVEARFARHLLDAWGAGTTSLVTPATLVSA